MRSPRDYFDALRRRREMEQKQADEAMAMIREIELHPETTRITRESLPGAWEFVEQRFPTVSGVISRTVILKNQNTAFCKRIGLPQEAGGLFFTKASAILICDNEFMDDVVIVHELLHYVSRLLGGAMTNQVLEENFAYSNSIPYLVGQGYDDKWIAEKYLLPFYLGLAQHEWHNGHPTHAGKMPAYCLESVHSDALKECLSMVASAKGQKVEREQRYGYGGRFDLL